MKIKLKLYLSIIISCIIIFTSCEDNVEPIGNRSYKIYLKSDGLEITTDDDIKTPYIGEAPAEGVTFTIEGVLYEEIHMIELGCVSVNGKAQHFDIPLHKTVLSKEWGTVTPYRYYVPEFKSYTYKYTITLFPNDTRSDREFVFEFGCSNSTTDVIITQKCLTPIL